ncbi:amidohydrolase family protein (plasmid) [Acinetobacter baumannii]
MNSIDTHAHVFSAHDQFIATARYTPNYDAPVQSFISHLDKHNLTHGILIQPSFFGTNNDVMLKAIRQFPERLKGIAVVDTTATLEELSQLKEQGIVGIRLNLFGLPIPSLDTAEWKRFLTNLEILEWQIELHAPPEYLVSLLPLLNQYSLDIVIDHFGRVNSIPDITGSDYQEFLKLLNVDRHWIKISGFYRLGHSSENLEIAKKAYALLKEKGLISKLIWGSDWPHTQFESTISYELAFNALKKIVVDKQEQHMILSSNALKLFKF